MRAVRMVCCALGVTLGVAAPVRAQEAPPGDDAAADATRAALTPPVQTHAEPAAVDPASFGDREQVVVLLSIDVGADGDVVDARVLEGAGEPFDAAAITAVRVFRFEPARRGDVPIAARIRYRFVITRPPPVLESDAPSDTVPVTTEPERALEGTSADETDEIETDELETDELETDELGPDDVSAHGFDATAHIDAPAHEPLRHEVDRDDARLTAGAHGDPVRALELMPGVTGNASAAVGGIVVRGSHPLDTQVMVEGAPVPLLNHVGGYTSFFNAYLLDRVELVPSNFSVRFGRALGAVVDITVRDRFADGAHGGLDVNIVDVSLFGEAGGPSIAGGVAARRSWIDAIYGAVLGGDNLVQAPVYYDYQGIVWLRPTPDDVLRLLTYGSHDDVALDLREPGRDARLTGDIHNTTQFHRGQLEWRHRYSPTVRHDIRLMLGHLGYDQQVGRLLRASDEGLELNVRAELAIAADPRAALLVGLDGWGHGLNVEYEGPPAPPAEGDPDGFGFDEPQVLASADGVIARSAFYVESRLTPVDTWTVIAGARLDYVGDVEEWSLEPRLSSRLAMTPETELRAGVGLFAQPPQLGRTIPGFGNPALGLERAIHSTLGASGDVAGLVRVALDAYYKRLFDRIVATADGAAPYLVNDGEGHAYGAELSARWIGDRHFSAQLSYVLSRSERRDRDGAYRPFDYDQTHVLTVAAAYDAGDGWELGATFRWMSGTPDTPVVGAVYDAGSDRYVPRHGDINSARGPDWHRLDLRVAKTFFIGSTGRIQISLDVMNATNHTAQGSLLFSYDYRDTLPGSGFPIVPNLGIRGEL